MGQEHTFAFYARFENMTLEGLHIRVGKALTNILSFELCRHLAFQFGTTID